MTLAGETRAAVEAHPFLRRALRAGVVNHAAAARFLDVEGDGEAVAAAVRRYAEELPAFETADARARVSMESGLSPSAAGDLDTRALAFALERLHAADIRPVAAGVSASLAVVVPRRDGADALRHLEGALTAVPEGSHR